MELNENIINVPEEMKKKIFDLDKGKNEFIVEICGGKKIEPKTILDSPMWKDKFFVLLFVHAILSMMEIRSNRRPAVTGKNILH
jgi:hypothetical protein